MTKAIATKAPIDYVDNEKRGKTSKQKPDQTVAPEGPICTEEEVFEDQYHPNISIMEILRQRSSDNQKGKNDDADIVDQVIEEVSREYEEHHSIQKNSKDEEFKDDLE